MSKFIFMGSPFGPFWSAKYLNFGVESCETRILSRSIQETYPLRKMKNQVLLFLSSLEEIPKCSGGNLMICSGLVRSWLYEAGCPSLVEQPWNMINFICKNISDRMEQSQPALRNDCYLCKYCDCFYKYYVTIEWIKIM